MKPAIEQSRIKPASIRAMQLYGVPRSEIIHTCMYSEQIPQNLVNTAFQEYYLLYCTAEHFKKNSHCGEFYRDDRNYQIIYVHCTRWDVVNTPGQIRLSFRAAHKEYNIPAYVLVSL